MKLKPLNPLEPLISNLHRAVELGRDPRNILKTPQGVCLKLVEEVGEVAEVLLWEEGFLPHKARPKEPLIGEVADLIIMGINLLAKHYPEVDPSTLIVTLNGHLELKLLKWDTKVLTVKKKLKIQARRGSGAKE